jgi:hypothetical protein
VRTFSPFVSGIRDETPKLTYDYLNEGITFGGESIQDDRPDSLGFSWNVANMDANGTTGALILHHMNPSGERDEVIPMALERAPELSVQAPGTLQEGQSAPVAASATDANGDPLSFAWDLDDGKGFAVTAAQAVLTAEDGPSTRALRARVSDGRTPPVIADRVVTVENVPPAVTASVIGSPPSGVRATATDPSPADVAAGFAWSFDVGADGTVERQLTGPATVDVPLSTPPGRSAIRITATDKDGGTSAPVTIQADSPACRVPRLRGVKLAQARKRLASAGCRLGKVKRPGKGNRARQVVRSQSVKPGRLMPPGTPVSVVLRNR